MGDKIFLLEITQHRRGKLKGETETRFYPFYFETFLSALQRIESIKDAVYVEEWDAWTHADSTYYTVIKIKMFGKDFKHKNPHK